MFRLSRWILIILLWLVWTSSFAAGCRTEAAHTSSHMSRYPNSTSLLFFHILHLQEPQAQDIKVSHRRWWPFALLSAFLPYRNQSNKHFRSRPLAHSRVWDLCTWYLQNVGVLKRELSAWHKIWLFSMGTFLRLSNVGKARLLSWTALWNRVWWVFGMRKPNSPDRGG